MSSDQQPSVFSADSGVDVKDKVILVTGANRGIGKSFVDVFLKHGAKKVYSAVRNLEALKSTGNDDSRIVPLYLDLAKPETIAQAAEQSQDVDVVVNNAGILSQTGALSKDTVHNLQNEMNINVYGLIHMAQAYAPILKVNGGGIFVQLNSVASFRCGIPDVATYSASKAAAYSITQALKQDLAAQSTRVISVHPGPIATDMIVNASAELAKLAEHPDNVAEEVVQAIRDPKCPFHVFPDAKAKGLAAALQPYTTRVVEDGNPYG